MSDQDHLFLAVKVWAAAAWADGKISEEEAIAMKAIVHAGRMNDAQRAEATTWISEPVKFEDLQLARIPASERLHIFSVACGVATLDREVAKAEKAFLDRLAKALQLSADDIAKTKQAAGVS
jgi:uncharacterized membrane protein YebE (DUF533 family)